MPMPNADRVLEIEAAAEQGNNVDTEEQEYYRYIRFEILVSAAQLATPKPFEPFVRLF